jgi:hypothetical protein
MGEFNKGNGLDLMYEDGRPSYFKEKLQEGVTSGISETTASYLRESRPLSPSEYLSKAFTPPATVSPAMLSVSDFSTFSPRGSAGVSAATTPQTQSPPSFASNGLGIVVEDKLLNAPLLEQNYEITSVPYGKRLIPQIMDRLAATEPERIVFSLTTFSGGSLELRHISARTFTKAVDKTAWWLHNQIGRPDSIQPLGYIGPRKLAKVQPTALSLLDPDVLTL